MANTTKHKESLVHTAMRLFRQQGYASTGLQQILAESGAPKGSLYHYFPGGKEELGAAAVKLAARLIGEMLSELAEQHKRPAAFVRAYCAVMSRWMEESNFRSGCPIATTMLETAPHSPELTRVGNDAFDGWIAIVAPIFVGDGTSMSKARTKAQALISAMEGALLLARVRRNSRPIKDIAESYVLN
jgi:TetR/AcrR family transcriptional repressor of lmrAB and yxaGH operons